MKKWRLKIVESDQEYGRKMAEYLQKTEGQGMWVEYAGNPDSVTEESIAPDLLLLGESWQQEEQLHRIHQQLPDTILLLLSEDGNCGETIAGQFIDKYQGMDKQIKAIYDALAKEKEGWHKGGNRKELYAIYGPWEPLVAEEYAMQLCRKLEARKSVFYFQLCEQLGAIGSEYRDASDLLVYMRGENKNIAAKLRSIAGRTNNVRRLEALQNPENLWDLREEDFQNLWNCIQEVEEECVIIRYGCVRRAVVEQWKECEKIFCPYRVEVAKDRYEMHMNHILHLYEAEELQEKLHYVRCMEESV